MSHRLTHAQSGPCPGCARRKELASWNKKRDAARERYIEKATDAREDVLEHCIAQVRAAEEAVGQAEARLSATPAEAPPDAMLDAYNALRKGLLTDNAPLNERLKRLYAEFRIRNEPGAYLVLPVLRPDVIETHADPSGAIKVIDADGSGDRMIRKRGAENGRRHRACATTVAGRADHAVRADV